MRLLHGLRSYGVLALLTTVLCASAGAQQPPPARVDLPAVPPDVEIPANFPANDNPIAFFDDYSWRAFMAMVWPAKAGERGAPDEGAKIDNAGPRVFETYKALWETFHNDGSAPLAWDKFDEARFDPCTVPGAWGELSLGSFSKFSDLAQAGFGTLEGPLIAQPPAKPTYIRYFTAFNRIEYEKILSKQWYLRGRLTVEPDGATFDDGALSIKAAWMDMANVTHPERYYTREATVLDPVIGAASKRTIGLVGLHIVQKTPSRPQWIWSTFEHVDNVPDAKLTNGPFAFNDGTATAMPVKNPIPLDRVLQSPTPAPFNVTRLRPIHNSTMETNKAYRKALAGTVWANYALVATQWPLLRDSPQTPGTPANTFPGAGTATTAFANTSMETFEQRGVATSCMACHNVTMKATDFVWSLNDHAFPPSAATPNLIMANPAFRELRALLTRKTEADTAAAQRDAAPAAPK